MKLRVWVALVQLDLKMIVAKDCKKARLIAKNNGMDFIAYEEFVHTDGTREFFFNKQLSNEVFLYYEFLLPFDLYAFSALRLISFLQKRVKKLVLIAPFMPFLREHELINKTFSLNLFNLPIITLDAHFKYNNIISLMPAFKNIQEDMIIIFPDIGAFKRYNGCFKNDYIIGQKDRATGIAFTEIAKVANKKCAIVDDIVQTGFTLINTIKALKFAHALTINAYITHWLNENAIWGLDYLETSDTLLLENKNASIYDFSEVFYDLRRKLSELK